MERHVFDNCTDRDHPSNKSALPLSFGTPKEPPIDMGIALHQTRLSPPSFTTTSYYRHGFVRAHAAHWSLKACQVLSTFTLCCIAQPTTTITTTVYFGLTPQRAAAVEMPSTNKRAAPVTSPHFSAPSSTSEPPSKKRRMPAAQAEQKYYAVRVGRKPGVYLNWVDCQKQIIGHSGATFKSFTDRAHAAAFVAGRPIPASASAPQPIRYYGVAVGRETGVFTDWSTVQELITGWKLPKYQRFETRAEAEAFVRREGRPSNAGNKPAVPKDKPTKTVEEKARPTVQARKTVLVKEEEDTSAAVPARTTAVVKKEDTSTATARTTALVKKDKSSVEDRKTAVVPAPTIVYSDGSSLNNGKANARAGVGVFFGPGDPRNVSERLKGPLQTNQRAELTAVLRTLQAIPMTEPLTIRTDSMYSINCVTLWSKKWEKNKWCTAAGEVKNKDLVQAIREIYDARLRLGTATNFEWVKGHSGHPGNEAADRLANAGALMPEAEDDGSL